MNTVKELQYSLSQLIYSITDLTSLTKIHSTVKSLLQSSDEGDILPWTVATLHMKEVSSLSLIHIYEPTRPY